MTGFDGLNVLITGAATGLGAATAIGLARGGRSGDHELCFKRCRSGGDGRCLS
jgi:NAD(P)-dependent dehydrogenase (short-subunit alcohol dehydrogenase family)